MIVFDLKLGIFLILLSIGVGLALTRQLRRQHPPLTADAGQRRGTGYEQLPFGVIVLRSDATLDFANEAARRLLGLADGASPVALAALLGQVGDTLKAATPRHGLLTQPRTLRWWSYPLEGETTLLVLADGGELQQLHRRQQALIGQVSHELRTPLTALLAHAEIAQSPQTEDSVRQASLATIQRETQRMVRLVRDLLELYRLETAGDLPLQPTDLTVVAEEAMAQLFLRAEDCGLHLNLTADSSLPRVLAHPDRLKQVFLNLLDNAIKYCRPGDSIRVCLEKQSDSEVRCSVQDSGPGIAPHDLPHVTERLYRGRKDRDGSGMGLAIVSEILRHHAATLTIRSSAEGAERGTTLSWVLPAASPAAGTRNGGTGLHQARDEYFVT